MDEAVPMQREYVEVRNGAYYVTGSRVSLASIIQLDSAAQKIIWVDVP